MHRTVHLRPVTNLHNSLAAIYETPRSKISNSEMLFNFEIQRCRDFISNTYDTYNAILTIPITLFALLIITMENMHHLATDTYITCIPFTIISVLFFYSIYHTFLNKFS